LNLINFVTAAAAAAVIESLAVGGVDYVRFACCGGCSPSVCIIDLGETDIIEK